MKLAQNVFTSTKLTTKLLMGCVVRRENVLSNKKKLKDDGD